MNDFNGILPESKKELESLSGIGPYTSGAILSIAYEQKVAAVDGNVLRVFSRLYKIQEDIKDIRTKQLIKTLVEESLPTYRNGDYNQAIMELGATVCIPNGRPLCERCPLQDICEAHKSNMQMILPFRTKKTKRKMEERTVFILRYKNLYAIRKRPSEGLLASLYEYPNFDGYLKESDIDIEYTSFIKLPSSKHTFTHKEWYMKGYLLETIKQSDEYIWVSKEDIEHNYSIPRAFRTYTNIILKD